MNTPLITTIDGLAAVLAVGAVTHDESDGEVSERVDLLAHALQCTWELAAHHPDDIELQMAGLVHDIGHVLVPGDDAGHGIAGASAVRGLLGDRVANLVELHVPAKRFLVTVQPLYASALSTTSVHTLANQGGPMTDDEVIAFRALPDAASAVALRRADEAAKTPGRDVPSLKHWRPDLDRLAAQKR